MSERVRVNLSLKIEDVDLIDHFANQLGLSRASYCTVLIKQALGTISSNYGSVKVKSPEGDMLVWKGFNDVDDIEVNADSYYRSLEP